MLGTYGLGVPAPRAQRQNHTDLERYLRWEYGGRFHVETLLPGAARMSRKARTTGRSRLAEGIRAFIAAERSIAAGPRSQTPTSEGWPRPGRRAHRTTPSSGSPAR